MKDEGIVGVPGGNSNHNGNHNNGTNTNGNLNGQNTQTVAGNGTLNVTSHCTGCRELKREVDDLKRLVSHFIEPRTDALTTHSQTARSPPEVSRVQQAAAQLSLQHLPSCPPQFLPWLLNNGLSPSSPTTNTLKLLENLEATRNANTTPLSAFWSPSQANVTVQTSSSATNQPEITHSTAPMNTAAVPGQESSFVEQVVMDASETSSSASSTNTQLMLISPEQFRLNGNNSRQILDSVAAAVAASSSQLNTNTLAQLLNITTNPSLQHQVAALLQQQKIQQNTLAQSIPSSMSSLHSQMQQSLLRNSLLQTPTSGHPTNGVLGAANVQQNYAEVQRSAEQTPRIQQQARTPYNQPQQIQNVLANQNINRPTAAPVERTSYAERRLNTGFQRAASDDYVRIIRQQDLSEDNVRSITIPVPQASQTDPNFRPLTEHQVIQQVMQNKKYESVNVAETMAQLCKKLAEKRVFGSRLMAQTTVAAPNHSNYNNLPSSGIIYIQHVCRKVLGARIESDEEFWECFREAMRKLAARCRRVRHAKKVRSPKVEDLMSQHLHHQSAFLIKPDPLRHTPSEQQTVAALNMLGMDVDQINMADLQRSGSPMESQTPMSSTSRNSSTPTPSSSSKQDN
ncbi:hypothetical protein M3Y98_00283400 [Aphelenchoides besseyi]|nr:hypothetical protein M3Y98_00283400 [Aphelenchoides besseyi]